MICLKVGRATIVFQIVCVLGILLGLGISSAALGGMMATDQNRYVVNTNDPTISAPDFGEYYLLTGGIPNASQWSAIDSLRLDAQGNTDAGSGTADSWYSVSFIPTETVPYTLSGSLASTSFDGLPGPYNYHGQGRASVTLTRGTTTLFSEDLFSFIVNKTLTQSINASGSLLAGQLHTLTIHAGALGGVTYDPFFPSSTYGGSGNYDISLVIPGAGPSPLTGDPPDPYIPDFPDPNVPDISNLVPVAPISAIGFQDADDFGQQPTQVNVMTGVSAQDGVWSPQDVTPVGDVTNDVYANGTSDAWLDAISLEFEDPKLVNGQSWLRVYLQKGDVASDWQHLMLLPGLFNSDFEDDNPTGIDINPGGDLPDNTTIGWFDIPFDTNVMPAYILPNGNIGMTLRLWNMRVDAIELLVSDLMGDINLDGFVDDDDMSLLLSNWGTGDEWALGDLNEDGTVDDDDLSLLLANWNEGSPPPMGGDPVPEPASAALLLLGFSTLLKRRKMR